MLIFAYGVGDSGQVNEVVSAYQVREVARSEWSDMSKVT